MVFRKDTLARYSAFVNEWLEYAQTDDPDITITASELLKKYGISSSFSSYVTRQGFILPKEGASSRGKWTTKRETPFTNSEIKGMIDGFNAWKYSKKHPVVKDRVLGEVSTSNGDKNKLVDTSTQELINELRRRGYKGHITSEINF